MCICTNIHILNIHTHIHTRVHTQPASFSFHLTNLLKGFGEPETMTDDTCPKFHTVRLNSEPLDWEASF